MKSIKEFAILLAMFIWAPHAVAKIKSELVTYKEGETILEGFLTYDGSIVGPRPAVLVVHDWMGLNEYAKRRARELAGMGYIALAADIYGKGIRAKNQNEAAKLAGKYKADRALLRKRARAGLDFLSSHPLALKEQLAATGYCFGGTTVLELARSGALLKGVISFHGGLDTPNISDAKKIRAKVLVMHGADDPFVAPEEVSAFQKEMRDAKVDWQMLYYGGAVHSFTNPDAGADSSKGSAYNRRADERSYEQMKVFLKSIFGS